MTSDVKWNPKEKEGREEEKKVKQSKERKHAQTKWN
jgi:hypothetical protein